MNFSELYKEVDYLDIAKTLETILEEMDHDLSPSVKERLQDIMDNCLTKVCKY